MATREFRFQDEKSDKFWRVEVEGKSQTVTFGRWGTTGQAQTKEFASDEAARQATDKLIAEKVKKGYAELSGGAASPGSAAPPVPRMKPAAAPAVAPSPQTPMPAPAAAMAPAAEAAPPRALDLPASHIDLGPLDWRLATWRPAESVQPPAPPPFVQAECAERLLRLKTTGYGWTMDWSKVGIPEAMTREEAHFWYLAMTSVEKDVDPRALSAKLAEARVDGRVGVADVRAAYASEKARFLGSDLVLALRALVTAGELADLLLDGNLHGKGYQYNRGLLWGFRQHVIPALTPAELVALRDRVRPLVGVASWPADLYQVPAPFLLAAALGMHEELSAVAASWADDTYQKEGWCTHYHQPQLVLYGLRDPALVEQHFRRLKLPLKTPLHVAGWLAHTEVRALDVVRDSILAEGNRDEAEALLEVLARVHAPEAAVPMLELHLRSKAPKAARTWLDENPAHAAVGLVALAGGRGALADAAVEHLRGLKKKGYGPLIQGAAAAMPPEGRARVQQEVVDHAEVELPLLDEATTPAWLAGAVAPKKRPGWVAPADLPALEVDGRRATEAQVAAVLAALQASPLGEPQPLVRDLRAHADRAGSARFAWKLFERWLSEGAPSKEKWAMLAVGHLGNDDCALKLTPLVRAWPGESQHQRAVNGLEVLRAIGTDTALMQLNGIAQKLKFQGLKTRARELMEEIAKDRGLTRAELEDRVVPDCELDERGRRVFDLGARRFEFVLGPEMKPMLRDGEGKLRDALPKPGAKDDAARAEQALEDWKLMKKQIKEVARLQADRLEQAMVTGRRWSAADFRALVLRHPLMTHVARLLLWGVYDAGGALRAAFRVTEEQDLADVRDDPFALPADGRVGVVHPLQMEEGAREAWGQVFSDYKLIQPFPQLGRPIHRLEPGEKEQTSLGRFAGLKLPAPTLVFTLEKLGWARGVAMDAGCFDEHSRQFPAAGVTALVTYDGTVGMGFINADEVLTVTGCWFVPGLREPGGYEKPEKGKTLALAQVDPLVLSETLHDLSLLAGKGTP